MLGDLPGGPASRFRSSMRKPYHAAKMNHIALIPTVRHPGLITSEPTKEATMTSSTLIAPPVVTETEKRRQEGIAQTIRRSPPQSPATAGRAAPSRLARPARRRAPEARLLQL